MMTRRSKRRPCSHAGNEGAKFQHIPFDLVTEIFLRLPSESISRFRCLSKLWDSTFRSPNFIESFRTISSSRRKLLFACVSDNKTFFFSSPQRQDSSPLTASFLTSFPMSYPYDIHRQWTLGPTDGNVQSICNLSTGQILTLPVAKKRSYVVQSSLGFDPVDKQLKVLCTTESNENGYPEEQHQVLTLGDGDKMSWRKIKCDIPHFDDVHRKDGICINGVLYYLFVDYSDDEDYDEEFPDIVCFNVRSEKFSYIKKDKKFADSRRNFNSNLVNYKGKLAKLKLKTGPNQGIYTDIQMWVLQDAKKHQWSSYTYVLPPPWKSIVAGATLRFLGITNKGEIVMSPWCIGKCFYLVYYNPERNSLTKVEIKGMQAYRGGKAYVFLDHVEDVNRMPNI